MQGTVSGDTRDTTHREALWEQINEATADDLDRTARRKNTLSIANAVLAWTLVILTFVLGFWAAFSWKP